MSDVCQGRTSDPGMSGESLAARKRDDAGDTQRNVVLAGSGVFRCMPCNREYDKERAGDFDQHLVIRHGVCRVKNGTRMTFRAGDGSEAH